jgi:hypothetical protein
MKSRNKISTKLFIAVCAVCVISAASCSQTLPDNNVGFTSARAGATVLAVIGLIGVIIGGLALRAAGRIGGNGRPGALVSVVLGIIVSVLSAAHLGRSTGGFGTGGGRAGAIVALVLGLIGISLGGLALARLRRSHSAD